MNKRLPGFIGWIGGMALLAVAPTFAWGNPNAASSVQSTPPAPTLTANDTNDTPTWRPKKKLSRHRKVVLQVKLIYAHVRSRPYVDPRIKEDVPVLNKLFDFNAYKLLREFRYHTRYRQAVIFPISFVFQVQLSPQRFDKKSKHITLQATFLYRRKPKGKKHARARFTQYASTSLRLRSGGKVAFLGPRIKYGRALLVLSAHQARK